MQINKALSTHMKSRGSKRSRSFCDRPPLLTTCACISSLMIFLAAPVASEDQRPWDSIGSEAFPDAVRPPAWLNPYLKTSAQGKHNDLPALLQSVHKDQWVTVYTFNLGARDMFLNSLYSYLTFGAANFFFAATVGEPALQDCLAMGLPCFNATDDYIQTMKRIGKDLAVMHDDAVTHAHGYKSPGMIQLTWSRLQTVLNILKLGYHVHATDTDTVYLRKVWPSIQNNLFGRYNPDWSCMFEEGAPGFFPAEGHVNTFNAGVVFVKSNPRTIEFYNKWLAHANCCGHDQEVINMAFGKAGGALCTSLPTCLLLQREGKAAMLRHPSQSPNGNHCYDTNPDAWDACSDRRLYVHTICGANKNWKVWALRQHSLWFLKDRAGNEIDEEAVSKSKLKDCRPDTAWNQHITNYYYT